MAEQDESIIIELPQEPVSTKIPPESTKARSYFEEYCKLGSSRSLVKLCQKLGKKPGYRVQLETYSKRYEWVKRARVYDDEIRAIEHQAMLEAVKEMNQRHIQLGKEAQQIAFEQVKTLIDAQAFGSMATTQLLKIGIDLERLAHDQAVQKQDVVISGNPDAPLVVKTTWGTSETPLEDEKDDEA